MGQMSPSVEYWLKKVDESEETGNVVGKILQKGRYTDKKHSIYTFCREQWSIHSGNMIRIKGNIRERGNG